MPNQISSTPRLIAIVLLLPIFSSLAEPAAAASRTEIDAAIHVSDALKLGLTGRGVTIGVFDTGIDPEHAVFSETPLESISSSAYDTYYANLAWSERTHGTHVAGIIGGTTGIASGSGLFDLRNTSYVSQVLSEMADLHLQAYNQRPDVKIYNNSWGLTHEDLTKAEGFGQTIEDAMPAYEGALEHDKLIVAAAGNSGGIAPNSPHLDAFLKGKYAGHVLNAVNIDAQHLFEEGSFVYPGLLGTSTHYGASNLGVFASVWTIAAPGTLVSSALAGSGDDVIEQTGSSMAAPHVSGALALVSEAFPWMSAPQLADSVLSTTTDVGSGYELRLTNASTFQGQEPWFQTNAYPVKGLIYADDGDMNLEFQTFDEWGALVFWGSVDRSPEELRAILRAEAEKLIEPAYIEMAVEAEFCADVETCMNRLEEARNRWIDNFVEKSIIAEYGLGAGLLNVGRAVGGIAAIDLNRMARRQSEKGPFILETGTSLSGDSTIPYTIALKDEAHAVFRNDIREVRWNPALHINSMDDLKSRSEALKNGTEWIVPDALRAPEGADLPIGLVVTTSDDTASTLVLEGRVALSGPIDVTNHAALLVRGRVTGLDGDLDSNTERSGLLPGLVQSDATGTVGGTGAIRNLVSAGILSPGDAAADIGTLTVDETLRITGGTVLLDVHEDAHDIVRAGTIEMAEGTLLELAPSGFIERYVFDPMEYLVADEAWTLPEVNVRYDGLTLELSPLVGEDRWELVRKEGSMEIVLNAAGIADAAARRKAEKLDRRISACALTPAGEALVYWFDRAAGSGTNVDAEGIAQTWAAMNPAAHALWDAAALARTARLRDAAALTPLLDLAFDEAPQTDALLLVERARRDGLGQSADTERLIAAGGASVRSAGSAFGWKLGAFTEETELSSERAESESRGVFASLSGVWENNGWRLFSDALAGFAREQRSRTLEAAGGPHALSDRISEASFGLSLGLGRMFKPSTGTSFMPYARSGYDLMKRGALDEGSAPVAQTWEQKTLSLWTGEAGLAWKIAREAFASSGRIAWRERIDADAAEHWTWAGVPDDAPSGLENRHAILFSAGLEAATGAGRIGLMLDAEAGDAGLRRTSLSVRWLTIF